MIPRIQSVVLRAQQGTLTISDLHDLVTAMQLAKKKADRAGELLCADDSMTVGFILGLRIGMELFESAKPRLAEHIDNVVNTW